MAWLESKLQVAYKIEGAGPREEIWEIPLTVFKEAIINALSHIVTITNREQPLR